ncbi:hypothetical protein HOY82DRAFT_624867 [Tuber indicum]|nr:hypothetical protein HOY82DRAFT_624867 [Tuber indicum]
MSLYNAAEPDVALGGLTQNGSITEENRLNMLEILLVVEGEPFPLRVQARISNQFVSRTEVPLETGVHDTSYEGINEPRFHDLLSNAETCREERFRKEVSDRDRKWVILGHSNPEFLIPPDVWAGFEATTISPAWQKSLLIHYNYGHGSLTGAILLGPRRSTLSKTA